MEPSRGEGKGFLVPYAQCCRRPCIELHPVSATLATGSAGVFPLENSRIVTAAATAMCAGLAMLDTISRFWRVKDESGNGEVLRDVEPLLDLAWETGGCVLIPHHDGKNDTSRAFPGASALPGLADLILDLKRPAPTRAYRRPPPESEL